MAWDIYRLMEKGTELPSVSQKDSTRFLCQAKKGNKEINNNILTTLTDEENYCKEKQIRSFTWVIKVKISHFCILSFVFRKFSVKAVLTDNHDSS